MLRTLWKFQRLGVISIETPQGKWASSRLKGRTSWIFSSCGRCSGLTMGTSGTHPGALRKGQSPWELLWGLSGFLSRRFRGLDLVWSPCRNLRIPLQCLHGSWGTSGVSQVSQSSYLLGACMCNFLPSCNSSVTLPFSWIQESVAFLGGFPTRLSHEAFPQGCPTCHRGVSRSSA